MFQIPSDRHDFKPHSEQQAAAFLSKTPITLLATGIQFGKTTVGALWMKMNMHRFTDKLDNFIITSPTYKILAQSTLPPFLRYMDGFGVYHRQDSYFELYDGGKCYFRTMSDPDSIVGITNVRAIYGDEAGLYSLYAWENIQARAAFKSAQTLLTTSPYTLNWVYKDLIRPKQKDKNARADVTYIKARSIDNPYFPKDYYERMRATMDERRFRAMFGGEWEKMDGLVYNCFDEDENTITPFGLPHGTVYYAGVDWGTTAPFVIVIRAILPNGDHIQCAEVYKTGLTILDMIQQAKQKCLAYPIKAFYCDPSSPGYIEEFNRAGLVALPADNRIRVGLDLHYDLIKTRRYKLFRGDNKHTIDEYETYHYPSEDEIKQDTEIQDQLPIKQNDHAMDANRYVTMATYQGHHRRPPEIITHGRQEKLTIEERMQRIREPRVANVEEW